MTIATFTNQANNFGRTQTPFFFLIDFEMQKPFICELEKALEHGFSFEIDGLSNHIEDTTPIKDDFTFEPNPIAFTDYCQAFDKVQAALQHGNSYLLNLTFPTELNTNLSLQDIYSRSKARFKLLAPNFVLFSPESFVKTVDNQILSCPMKGTIDANLPHAAEQILSNHKELWEHNTIVDLIRNDLSIVATNVKVNRFRYIDSIKTHNAELLQVSSEISGQLATDWQTKIGDIITKLLPAGSISGAPKAKTIEIIRQAEITDRNYYTGIFGVFDGENINSGVNIRFIQAKNNKLYFHSGGGITAYSNAEAEYKELLDKVYVPFV